MSDDGDEQVVDAVVEQSGHLQQLAASLPAQPLTLCTQAGTATSSVHGDFVNSRTADLQQLAASLRAQSLPLCTHAATATSSVHVDLGKSRTAAAARSHLCTHPIRCDWLGRNGLIITRAVRHFAITTFGYGRWKRLPSCLAGK